MNFFRNNNTVMIGILIGATIPIFAYAAVEGVFEILTNAGIIDEVTQGSIVKRKRTLALIALCSNILTVQFFKTRSFEKILTGIVTATIIYAIIWFFAFKII